MIGSSLPSLASWVRLLPKSQIVSFLVPGFLGVFTFTLSLELSESFAHLSSLSSSSSLFSSPSHHRLLFPLSFWSTSLLPIPYISSSSNNFISSSSLISL